MKTCAILAFFTLSLSLSIPAYAKGDGPGNLDPNSLSSLTKFKGKATMQIMYESKRSDESGRYFADSSYVEDGIKMEAEIRKIDDNRISLFLQAKLPYFGSSCDKLMVSAIGTKDDFGNYIVTIEEDSYEGEKTAVKLRKISNNQFVLENKENKTFKTINDERPDRYCYWKLPAHSKIALSPKR